MLALASVLSTAALLNPSGISVQQLRLVYYTRELLEQTEEICQKCFLPRTGFLLFRAARHPENQPNCHRLLNLLEEFLAEADETVQRSRDGGNL